MRLGIVCDLIAHARRRHERSAIFEFRVQLVLETQKDVPLRTPRTRSGPGDRMNDPSADPADSGPYEQVIDPFGPDFPIFSSREFNGR